MVSHDQRRAPHRRFLVRNAAILVATAASVVVVFRYPTSHNSSFAATPTPTRGPADVTPRPSDTVVTGAAVKTEYGPVQVQLRIRNGKIIAADAIKYPQGFGLDDIVNGRAIPILEKETLAAQSAHIDAVSSATYTSGGYLTSLQSALDQAHLGGSAHTGQPAAG